MIVKFDENKNDKIGLLLLTVLNIQTLDIIQTFKFVIQGMISIKVSEKTFFDRNVKIRYTRVGCKMFICVYIYI